MLRREFLETAGISCVGAFITLEVLKKLTTPSPNPNISASESIQPEVINTAPNEVFVACVSEDQQSESAVSSEPYIRVNGREFRGNLTVVKGSAERGSGYVSWYDFNGVDTRDGENQVLSEKFTPENGEVIFVPFNRGVYTPGSLFSVYEPNFLRWSRRDLLRYLARVCFSTPPAIV